MSVNPNAVLNGGLIADAERVSKNVPAPPRQIVATRGVFPTLITETGGNTYTRFESHIDMDIGESPCSGLKLHYTAMRSNVAEDAVTNVSNFTLQASIVFNDQFNRVSIAGTVDTPVQAGATLISSNPVAVYLPAGSVIRVKTGAIVAAGGQSVPAGLSQTGRIKKVGSTDAASQIFSRFSINNTGGRTDTSLGLTPFFVTGIPKERHVAIAGWGDSIMTGVGDATDDASGMCGWFERACHDVDGNGRCIPFVNLSKAGDNTITYLADEAPSRFAALEYVTHVIYGLCNNSPSAGRTLEEMQAAHLEAWEQARIFGVEAGATTMPPRTTSTDNWATVENQTPVAGYTTDGIRGQFNAWLRQMLAERVLDFIIDINSVVADEANPDVFKPNATDDGTHLNPAYTAITAADAKTQLLKLTV